MSAQPIVISDWKPRVSNSLRGFFTVTPPSGLVLHELSLHTKDGTWWLGFPAKPMVIDGNVQRDEGGKVRYGAPLISFASRQARDRFNAQVIEALREAQPEVFAAEPMA
jgi:hypothetical protein